MDPGCQLWEVEGGEWWWCAYECVTGSTDWVCSTDQVNVDLNNWVDSHQYNQPTDHKMCTLTSNCDVVTWFMNIHSFPNLYPAHPSWRWTVPGKTHYYCLKFAARTDPSHHVWGMSKVGEWKITWCSTETSQNHCTGVWWADHILWYWLQFRLHLLAIDCLFTACNNLAT